MNSTSRPFSYHEWAEAIQTALGEPIAIETTTQAELEAKVSTLGLSPIHKILTINMQNYALGGNNGEASADPSTLESLLGRPLTPLAEAVKEFL